VSETADHRRLTELRSILREIEDAGWEYARVEIDGVSLVVSSDPGLASDEGAGRRTGTARATAPVDGAGEPAPPATTSHAEPAAPAAAPAPPDAAPPAAAAEGPVETITSPTIGLFWRSPKPGAPPFVGVGDTVAAGDTVCIIEVMKLMTHVASPVDGTVRAIHMENGSMVQHGTALVDIEPAGPAQ
jgi:acetyl-CoA carboxylase biotin carboxyl carrier protein